MTNPFGIPTVKDGQWHVQDFLRRWAEPEDNVLALVYFPSDDDWFQFAIIETDSDDDPENPRSFAFACIDGGHESICFLPESQWKRCLREHRNPLGYWDIATHQVLWKRC